MLLLRYLTIGNLTIDEKDGWTGIGGTVAYGAWAALHFTEHVLVVSKVGRDFPLGMLNDLSGLGASFLIEVTGDQTARFRRTESGLVMISPGPSDYMDLPIDPRDFNVIFLGPVSGELDEQIVNEVKGSFLALDVQGIIRSRESGPVTFQNGEWIFDQEFDLIHLNEDEAIFLTGHKDPIRSLKRISEISKGVLLTRGEKGSLLWFDGGLWKVGPTKLKVVDSTGAGDVYTASLSILLAMGSSVDDSLAKSVALTTFILEHLGVPNRLISPKDLEEREKVIRPTIEQLL